jgi:hypothetical protein
LIEPISLLSLWWATSKMNMYWTWTAVSIAQGVGWVADQCLHHQIAVHAHVFHNIQNLELRARFDGIKNAATSETTARPTEQQTDQWR